MKSAISFVIYLVLINFQGCRVFDNFTQQSKPDTNPVMTTENARNKVLSDMVSIERSIDIFLLNTNRFPGNLNELFIDPGLAGWAGPYIKNSQLYDPWGNPYIYKRLDRNSPGSYQLITYGADGEPSGEGINADIYND